MRIHTTLLTESDVYKAARAARVTLDRFTRHGSRKRDHAFDITLQGESRRRQNGGEGYAATWDQWGVFLSVLFDLDPTTTTTYYADRDAFHRATAERFLPSAPTGTIDNFHSVEVGNDWYAFVDYWPSDAHGDHTFRFAGIAGVQACTKCSAEQTWA